MTTYIEKLHTYVTEHPSIFENSGTDTILDTLYWNYAESNQLESDLIRDKIQALYACMEFLCLRDKDKILDIVYALCSEHQRISFAAGIQVGVQLTQELSK